MDRSLVREELSTGLWRGRNYAQVFGEGGTMHRSLVNEELCTGLWRGRN